ncbi:MAG: hypothetical protein ACRD2A_18035 [Vicinamibacterales bacterium]
MAKMTDRSLEILSRLTTLERLELSQLAGITDAGLKALAALPRLRDVSIGGSPHVTRAGVAQFAPHVRVKYEALNHGLLRLHSERMATTGLTRDARSPGR